MKVAFIGLGVMGYPMAGHLQAGGHQVTVYNRSPEKARDWQHQYGGTIAGSPAEAVEHCEMVFSCVGRDTDVEEVTIGENGAFRAMPAGSIFVDHTTTSAILARRLDSEAAKLGFEFLDAPVSGGQAGAENGVLSIMVGGKETVFNKAKPVMEAYGRTIALVGDSGCGQLCKMVNQICIAGLVQGLAEAIHFGKAAGLDMEKVMSVIRGGAAQSWQLENRYQTMMAGQYDFGFAVDWMRKDLAIVMEEAGKNGVTLPVTEIVDAYYKEVQAMGGGRWDTSSLLARLEK